MAINPKILRDGAKVIRDTGDLAKELSKNLKRDSIVRKGKAAIYEFPLLAGSDIAPDALMPIAKALEKYMAAYTLAAYSLHPVMDGKKYGTDMTQFVKSFHNNDSIGTNYYAASNMLDTVAALTESDVNVDAVENIEEEVKVAYESEVTSAETMTDVTYGKEIGAAAWESVVDMIAHDKLNDISLPFKRSEKLIGDRIKSMRNTAMEATGASTVPGAGSSPAKKISYSDDDLLGITDGDKKSPKMRNFDGNKYVTNNATGNMEPTMINVQVVFHGKKNSGPNQFTQTLTLGIKSMVRTIKSDLMVSALSDACTSHRKIFNFIKWTEGERHFVRDVLFDFNNIKDEAMGRNRYEVAMIRSAKKRKRAGTFGKFFANKTMPNLMIVITSAEAQRIKEATGIDLTMIQHALHLMNELFLLEFGIYDPETDMFSYVLDSFDEFTTVSLSSLNAVANQKTNLTDVQKLLKELGRM